MKEKNNLNTLIKVALLSAIAFILMYIDFPVIPMFPWLKIDLSEVPVLMGAFAFGPGVGIVIEFIKNLLIVVMKGSQTGLVGEAANFIVGIAMVVPAAMIYKRNKTKRNAIIGMIVGIVVMEVVGIVANVYFLLPAYGMQMSPADLMQYVTVGLLPFNGIKGILISIATYMLYKKLSVTVFNDRPIQNDVVLDNK
ncbi:ECF transporter S component [Clostridium sp. CCUG 7971]|uniref:ECF transporter S component n=1 Tax=Clostridium sp. CCUG 7971 TaxID=2811414 RepID=UPI001ABA0E4C|nr:ECF transporter S component [Clostridium sp. CCUG 7971]MBO3445091.1 ECF transporter S component [Clostridium sp. CCUG 7971]